MKKGFTLIEMILVVAIITILSGVVYLGSLSTFKTSKVEGFSNEALSLIRQLYDYQSSKSMFIDQVTPKGQDVNLESTYNFVFEVDTGRGEITAKLRNGTSQIDEALLSNVASIKDMTVKFSDNVLSPSPTDSVMYPQGDTSITSYVLSFDSSGRVIRSIDNSQAQTLKDLKLEMNIQNGNFARDIVISSPPSGNIVLEKRGGE